MFVPESTSTAMWVQPFTEIAWRASSEVNKWFGGHSTQVVRSVGRIADPSASLSQHPPRRFRMLYPILPTGNFYDGIILRSFEFLSRNTWGHPIWSMLT